MAHQKLAANGDEVAFEQAFADMAYTLIQSKTPGLIDYLAGFQLLERGEDDEGKAAGLFGFKIGDQWVYAPRFFLNGEIKGHELLYLKNRDQMVPAQEKWVNYLINRKPRQLGQGVNRYSARDGVRPPDFQVFYRPKYSSALPAWAGAGVAALAHAATTNPLPRVTLRLEDFLVDAGIPTIEKLARDCLTNPGLASAIESFHGIGMLKRAAERAWAKPARPGVMPDKEAAEGCGPVYTAVKKTKKHPNLKVAVYTEHTTLPLDITAEERDTLLREGRLIRDKRSEEETSKAYRTTVGPERMTNPTESGVYDVFTTPESTERCLVLMRPLGKTQRYGFAVVVRLDDGLEGDAKAWRNVRPSEIWIRPVSGTGEDDESARLRKWVQTLPDADSKTLEDGHSYLAVTSEGDGTVVFQVEDTLGSGGKLPSYSISCHDYASCDPCGPGTPVTESYGLQRYGHRDGGLLIGPRGSRLRCSRDLFVPGDAKLLHIDVPPAWWTKNDSKRDAGHRDFSLASAVDLELSIINKTAALKVYHDGCETEINGCRMTPGDAVLKLMGTWGLRESDARTIVKEAASRHGLRCRVKLAAPYVPELQQGSNYIPEFPEPNQTQDPTGLGYPAFGPQREQIAVGQNETDPSIYHPMSPIQPDMQTYQAAEQAASMGQKEVFDTAVIGGLLRSSRDESLIDRYLPKLLQGLDALGRLLFNFYWHSEQFTDRYGKGDLPELEDSLRNAFETLGDVAIYLQEKSIDPYPGAGIDVTGLDDAAQAA